MKLSKRATIIIISTFAVLITLFTILFITVLNHGEKYRLDLSLSYSRSLGEFNENLAKMETALKQAKYVSTPTGIGAVTGAIRESSGAASATISYLPFSENNIEEIEKSLSVMGDFALYLENKIASGKELDEDDYIGFEYLAEHCNKIYETFSEIQTNVDNGTANIGETHDILQKSLRIPSIEEFDNGLNEIASEVSALPRPIYDGAFSEHIEQKEAMFLKDKKEVSEGVAQKIAAKYLDISEDSLSLVHSDNSSLASYQFSGEDYSIKITKLGGQVLYYKKNTDTSNTSLQYEDALAAAKKELEELGFMNMVDVFYTVNDNICSINFCAIQNDVILYTDSVNVSIELNEGGMVELTSEGYLLNHYERELTQPAITQEEAAASISEKLEIQEVRLSIIPSAGKEEILTYEFTCADKQTGEKVDVFINSESGYEERIYIIKEF